MIIIYDNKIIKLTTGMRRTHDGSGDHHPASTPLWDFLMSRGGGARPSRRSCPEKIYLLKEEKILPSMTKGKMRIKVAEKKEEKMEDGEERREIVWERRGEGSFGLLPTNDNNQV